MSPNETSPVKQRPTMGRRFRAGLLASVAVIGLGSAFVTGQMVRAAGPVIDTPLSTANAPASFSTLAKKVSPAVVNVAAEHSGSGDSSTVMRRNGPMPFPPGSPFDEFFRRFFDEHGQGQSFGQGDQNDQDQDDEDAPAPHSGQKSQALGSGFFIDAEGHVVTNNHVVDGADKIKIILNDGSSYDAEVVGRDVKTDLALLKAKVDKPISYVNLGDSDKAEVGDWVVAVGNPFGLGGTVTAGIISARGRDIHSGPYDDFLQIDAPINRGNSGGPLFDLTGQVIGVNTAIYSPNGGSVGIGFAIPSSIVKTVVADLKSAGHVDRGWLGVSIQPVTPDLAESLGLEKSQGALVAEVVADGPAAKAGLKQRDVILSVGNTAIDDVRGLVRQVAGLPQGQKVDVAIWRDGAKRTIPVTVGATPNEQAVASIDKKSSKVAPTARLGLAVAPMTAEAKNRYGIKNATAGVVVVDVTGDGPAAEAGIRPGDVIVKAGDKAIENPQALSQAVDAAATESKKSVLLMVERQGQPLFVAVRLAKA